MTKLTKKTPVIFHYRRKSANGTINPRGGLTVVFNPETRNFGVSRCSRSDNFCRKTGIFYAMKRSQSSPLPPVGEENMTMEFVKDVANKMYKDEGKIRTMLIQQLPATQYI